MKRKNAYSPLETRCLQALAAARPHIADLLRGEIEGNALVETKPRPGAVASDTGHYFHRDTIKDRRSLRAIKQYDKLLDQIDVCICP
jgi:hypothetical protein